MSKTRVCKCCGKRKPLNEEHFFRAGKKPRPGRDAFRNPCKDCYQKESTKWRQENREACRVIARRSYYKHQEEKQETARQRHAKERFEKFGLSPEDYQKAVAAQGGVCAICKQPETRKIKGKVVGLSVDHDHSADDHEKLALPTIPPGPIGVFDPVVAPFRGLICTRCNLVLGLLGDDPDLFESFALYLRQAKVIS